MRPEARRGVRLERVALRQVDEAARDTNVELRAQRRVDVRSHAVLGQRVRSRRPVVEREILFLEAASLEVGQVERARLLFALAGQEVADGVRPGGYLRTKLIAVAVPDRRRVGVVCRRIDTETVQDAALRRHLDQRALAIRGRVRRMAGDRVVPRIRVAVLEVSAFAVEIPARRARAALLGRDDDDAVCCIRTIERGGRRSLHDLDALDLLRIDVAHAARVAATGAIAIAANVARHPDPVDHVDGIVGEVERILAADANARPGAGLHPGLYGDTGRARVDEIIDVPDRSFLDD